MNDNLHDTKPRPAVQVPTEPQRPAPTQPLPPYPRPHQPNYDEGVPAPPRFLLWGVVIAFVLGIMTVIGGVVAFRFVLEPAQQERVMQALPFMEALLPPRPAPGDTLPTPDTSTVTTDLSPADLLGGGVGATAEPTLEPTIQSTTEPTLEPTLAPTLEPTAAPTESVQVVPTLEPTTAVSQPVSVAADVPTLPRSSLMTGITYQKQTWNNCGPSNVTMALSYYGWQRDQTYAAQFLKPGGREDKNVSPDEMAAFVNEQSSVRAIYRVGGTVDLMRSLLANNFPVIIETGFMPEGYDWIGHYRTLVGYDDNQGTFYLYDSFLAQAEGTPIPETYPALDQMWRHFNRTYIVVYEPQREELLRSVMGDHWDERAAVESALEVATAEATADRTDGHAWFNLGSSLSALGDYERAAIAYDRARVEGVPWRMTWYQFGPFEAYYGAGRYNEVLSLADANLANGADYVEETYYWQGRALNALNRGGEAATAFRTALRRKPGYGDAQAALNELGL
jgi:hypothetical protein